MKKWSDSQFSWIALKMIPNLGNITYKRLLDRFGEPANVFMAKLGDLMEVEGLRIETAKRIASRAWEDNPEDELIGLKRSGAKLITIFDSSYPKDLKEIHDPPPLLYLKGNDIPQGKTTIAVVGSRNPTHYGLKITEEICQSLAIRNITVTSGMARGIDSAAHWGCLRGNGLTIAVLGSGIDIIYPKSNRKLFNHIVDKGSVITEFPLGSPPEAKNFPIRNRIISGLSKGIVVVEASKRSGSLITASLALEQGREVLAIPGSIESFKSTGTHFLIKQGAKLVENADDILQELGLNYPYSKEVDMGKKVMLPPMEEDEKQIYNILGNYPLHIDHIVRNSKMDSARVASLLTGLELKGVIKQLPGKMFIVF
ncbi:MAG: DNA-protecting protein DprA [Deltaproteobacteria bacterium]|jgi:DNA processing protein|nr:MAG: DNA-protecting protein DprA [Deltaproteobacteria bacterium]